MANDLTPTGNRALDRATPWSPPQLTTSLNDLLADQRLWTSDATLPALDDADRAVAQRALAIYADCPRGTPADRVAALMGATACVMPARTGTAEEEAMRQQVYQEELADVDDDVLTAAFKEARRTLTFFPTIAELRAIVGRLPAPPRVVKAWRLRQLLAAKEAAPVDQVAPGALTELKETVAAALDAGRSAPPARTDRLLESGTDRSMPSLADYETLGLSEEEALEQWGKHAEQERRRREANGRARVAQRDRHAA